MALDKLFFTTWRTDEPPKDKQLELLCVLFDEDKYRALTKNPWGWNRFVCKGVWHGCYFTADYPHASGDPFLQVVAWRNLEEDLGLPFYPKCIGVVRDGFV